MENKFVSFSMVMPDGREYTTDVPLTKSNMILHVANVLNLGIDELEKEVIDINADDQEFLVTLEETIVHSVLVFAPTEEDADWRARDIVENGKGLWDTTSAGDLRVTHCHEIQH